jgi:hypothetical protein
MSWSHRGVAALAVVTALTFVPLSGAVGQRHVLLESGRHKLQLWSKVWPGEVFLVDERKEGAGEVTVVEYY